VNEGTPWIPEPVSLSDIVAVAPHREIHGGQTRSRAWADRVAHHRRPAGDRLPATSPPPTGGCCGWRRGLRRRPARCPEVVVGAGPAGVRVGRTGTANCPAPMSL